MSSSVSPSSCFFFINCRPADLRRLAVSSSVCSSDPFTSFSISKHRSVGLSASVVGRKLEVSWLSPDRNATEDYGGWSVLETRIEKKKKGFPSFLLIVAGASVAILLEAAYRFNFSRKGLTFQFKGPLNIIQRIPMPSQSGNSQSEVAFSSDSKFDSLVSEGIHDNILYTTNQTNVSVEKFEHLIIPVNVDSTQQEALLILKKLKECKAPNNAMPSLLLSRHVIQAFDDVTIKDPDFWFIQALAEAGIVLEQAVRQHLPFLSGWSRRKRKD